MLRLIRGDLGFAVALMTLLTVGTTLFMPFALPLIIPGLQASPWSIARPLVEFILTPLAVGMLLQSRVPAFSAASQPVFAKLGNISALVLLALLVVLHFRDLLGVVGSGAIAISAVFMRDRLKVVFFPDFNVKNAHFIYPAADLSEQISTAGKEASGTGKMKFSLNDANVEIREEVGPENFFLFGLTAAEVEVKSRGYRPRDHYEQSATLREVIDFIASGALGRGDAELFRPLIENLLDHDPFLLLADYHACIDAQDRVSALWRDPHAWTRQSILNSARMGKFSSDRSIRDYCERVWKSQPASIAA